MLPLTAQSRHPLGEGEKIVSDAQEVPGSELSIEIQVHPANKAVANWLAGVLVVDIAASQDASASSTEREVGKMAEALRASLRPVLVRGGSQARIPYLSSEARRQLAARLDRHGQFAKTQRAGAASTLARVVAAVLRSEVADLVLGRADPGGALFNEDLVPVKDLNRLLAIEKVVEEQVRVVLPAGRVVDRVDGPSLFRFSINCGDGGLDNLTVDYHVGESPEAS